MSHNATSVDMISTERQNITSRTRESSRSKAFSLRVLAAAYFPFSASDKQTNGSGSAVVCLEFELFCLFSHAFADPPSPHPPNLPISHSNWCQIVDEVFSEGFDRIIYFTWELSRAPAEKLFTSTCTTIPRENYCKLAMVIIMSKCLVSRIEKCENIFNFRMRIRVFVNSK